MTLVWGNHGPTTNVYIAKMTDCPLPVRHTAVVPSDAMVFVFFCFFFLKPNGIPPCSQKTGLPLMNMCQTNIRFLHTFPDCPGTTKNFHVLFLSKHMQTKMPGYIHFPPFELHCFLWVCAYCICPHRVSCEHCSFKVGFYRTVVFTFSCGMREKKTGSFH